MLKKILNFLLIILLLTVLLAVGWAFQILLGWPTGSMWLWPTVPVLLWFAVTMARRYYVRYRAQRRLRTRPQQEQAQTPDEEWVAQVRTFLSATQGVDKSPLGEHQVHFVLGLSGSGKSTLLQQAASGSYLDRSLASPAQTPTQSCQLSFLSTGIAIEIAGQHIDPDQDAVTCDAGWKKLLNSMTADVLPSQVAGVIVCVSVDQLRTQLTGHTHAGLQLARQRINDLMELARRRLPVYVMLTYADQLDGVEQLVTHLPAELLTQSAGALLPYQSTLDTGYVRRSIDELARYMPWLALRATTLGGHAAQSGLLAARDIRKLQAPLETALMALFGNSAYHESPLYRGLFLSGWESRTQPAGAANRFADTGLVFGPGVFEQVLSVDRAFRPLSSFENLRKKRTRLAWTGYYAAVSLTAVWLVCGYINEVTQLDALGQFKLAKISKVDTAEKYAQSILSTKPQIDWLKKQADNSWNFLLPFSNLSDVLENELKSNFVQLYHRYQIEIIDKRFFTALDTSMKDSGLFHGMAIDYMIHRVSLILAASRDESLYSLRAIEAPAASASQVLVPELSDFDAKAIDALYFYYTVWDTNENLRRRLDQLKSGLSTVSQRDRSLSWLFDWVIHQPGVAAVNLSDYWNPTGQPSAVKVSGAYTLVGYQTIAAFMAKVNAVQVLREIYQPKEMAFWDNYNIQREVAWKNFMLQFPNGRDLLKTETDWVDLLTTFNSQASPFVRIEERLLQEFPEDKQLARPNWIASVDVLRSIRKAAANTSIIGSVVSKLDTVQSSAPLLLSAQSSRAAVSSATVQTEKNLMGAGKLYGISSQALAKAVSEAVSAPGKAAALASDFSVLGRDPTVKDSSLRDAFNAMKRLQDSLGARDQPANEPAWALLRGELVTTAAYAYLNAACTMQAEWESQVLAATQSAPDDAAFYDKVMGSDGVLWPYLDKTAKPFLIQSATGYAKASSFNYALPWDAEFLTFINRVAAEKRARDAATKKAELQAKLDETRAAARSKFIDARLAQIDTDAAKFNQAAFNVAIASFPLKANTDATTQPYGAGLTLNCAKAPQRLTQLNFSTSQVFNWGATTCGDSELKIFVDNMTLTTRWSGEFGFERFLRDFRDGKKTFIPTDFPDQKEALVSLGIKKIDVVFKISDGAVLQEAVAKYESEAAERSALAAEKLALEQAQAARIEKSLTSQISGLSLKLDKPVLPSKSVTCTL
jgi:type VI secretion system protein ImpL